MVDGRVVSPRGAPELPAGWTYRFSSRAMGEALIAIHDDEGTLVASQSFVGHERSPEFVLVPACVKAHEAWQDRGTVVTKADVRVFTATAGREGTGYRVWCPQVLRVSVMVDDLADAQARMTEALAAEFDLPVSRVRVTLVDL